MIRRAPNLNDRYRLAAAKERGFEFTSVNFLAAVIRE